jgi:hypothetical protein
MKRLLAAVMIVSAPAAFAVDASEVGPKAKETAQNVKEGAKQNAKEWGKQAGLATEDQGTFNPAKAFEMKGTIKDAGPEEITIARPGLPPASLDIRDKTKVMIDGKPAKASDLQEGAPVRAKFQVEGEETVAVVVRAQKAPASGGAGAAGSSGESAEEKTKEAGKSAEEKAKGAGKSAEEKTKEAGQDARDTANKASDDAQKEMDTLKGGDQQRK